jgi:hypothetical protein
VITANPTNVFLDHCLTLTSAKLPKVPIWLAGFRTSMRTPSVELRKALPLGSWRYIRPVCGEYPTMLWMYLGWSEGGVCGKVSCCRHTNPSGAAVIADIAGGARVRSVRVPVAHVDDVLGLVNCKMP